MVYMTNDERPLHVRVAAALGWSGLAMDGLEGLTDRLDCWYGVRAPHAMRESVPRYDTSWGETGPLIEKYKIELQWENTFSTWGAGTGLWENAQYASSPLVAVCNLLLALSAAGKLEP